MTSPRPDRVTCLACREHARLEHLRIAEQVERLGGRPESAIGPVQAKLAANGHRDLAERFSDQQGRVAAVGLRGWGARVAGRVVLGVAGTPGLTETPAAESGEPVTVTSGSGLGRHVRRWLTESRQASVSLNDHAARHMADDERTHALLLGWLTRALRSALCADSVTAAYGALITLTDGPDQAEKL